MNYIEALTYLEHLKSVGMQMGLERMIRACDMLGNPERAFPSVHIAGTNGKGSTARMIADMLTANGYRTGLYTSPAVTDLRDMILIDGTPVSKECFASCIAEIAAYPSLGLSEYECLTTAVFLCFAKEKVDIAVIECCLGGDTDATNVLPPPLCAVFTPIALDHTAILGNTIEEIASHKSGIIKRGCDVVCASSMSPDALGVIFEKASQNGCTVHIPAETAPIFREQEIRLSLLGEHQLENAHTALEVMSCLNKRGYRFDTFQSLAALQYVRMPCRQELVSNNPMILLDGAHNPHGIAALCNTLKEIGTTDSTLVIGMLADKDVETCIKMLVPLFDRIICTTPVGTPRALPAEQLACIVSRYHDTVNIIDDPAKAFAQCKKNPGNLIVVGGSFYTASAVRREICE